MGPIAIGSNPSESSMSPKFFYQTACPVWSPESIRHTRAINQQIATDLLYVYDPFQVEVGKTSHIFIVKNELILNRTKFSKENCPFI